MAAAGSCDFVDFANILKNYYGYENNRLLTQGEFVRILFEKISTTDIDVNISPDNGTLGRYLRDRSIYPNASRVLLASVDRRKFAKWIQNKNITDEVLDNLLKNCKYFVNEHTVRFKGDVKNDILALCKRDTAGKFVTEIFVNILSTPDIQRTRPNKKISDDQSIADSINTSNIQLDEISKLSARLFGFDKNDITKMQEAVAQLNVLLQTVNLSTLNAVSLEDESYKSYDGGSYEGHLRGDKRHGQGTYTWPDGSSHTGEWANDAPNGYGVRIYSNGDKYEGSWVDNRHKGFGTYTWRDGKVYVGDFDEDRDGTGKMTYSNDFIYDGGWKEGKLHGRGRIIFTEGEIYEGNFENDQFIGYGYMTYPDDPSFAYVMLNGEATSLVRETVITDDGTVIIKQWDENEEPGENRTINVKATEPDGTIFEGIYCGNKSSGTWTYPDGATEKESCERYDDHTKYRYEYEDGSWYETVGASGDYIKAGLPKGTLFEGDLSWFRGKGYAHGKCTRPDGAVYEGDFWDSIPHGKGKLTKPNGIIIEGEWQNGKPKR